MWDRARRAARRFVQCYGPVRGTAFFVLYVLHIGTGTVTRAGTRYVSDPVWLRRGTSDDWTFQQVFVDEDYRLGYTAEPATVIDAGANIGLASLWLARRFPGAAIVAVEPDAENLALLERNIADQPAITAVHAALWRTSGMIDLVDPGFGSWGFQTVESTAAVDAAAPPSVPVRAVTVRELMDDRAWDRVGLLKIDIEGSELEVLGAADEWIASVDAIAAELHDDMRPGCSTAFDQAIGDAFAVRQVRGENVFAARS